MAYSASELKLYCSYLNASIKGKRLSRLNLVKAGVYLFRVSSGDDLLLSASNGNPFIYLGQVEYDGSSINSPLAAILRKKASNAEILSINLLNDDRIIEIKLIGLNDVFKEVEFSLILELLPNCPNLILVEEGRIITAQHLSLLDSMHPIVKGLEYVAPDKKFSSLKEPSISIEEMNVSLKEKASQILSVSKKEKHNELYKFIAKKKKTSQSKIKAIESDIDKANAHLHDGDIGTYILSNLESIHQGDASIDYYGETITINKAKSPVNNAQTFFNNAKKAKKTIENAKANLEKANAEKEEFDSLSALFDSFDEETIQSIEIHYDIKKAAKKNQDAFSPSFLPLEATIDGVTFLFGKSAKSNEYLTFNLAKDPEYIWMHLKNEHGPHLIIKKEHPSNEEITLGAMLTLLASKKSDGEVMYAKRKNLRKGSFKGQVIMDKYECCYCRHIEDKVKKAFESAHKIKA